MDIVLSKNVALLKNFWQEPPKIGGRDVSNCLSRW